MVRYAVETSRQFEKDLAKLKKRGLATGELRKVMTDLAEGETLPPERKDHPLQGTWKAFRECHVGFDLLLVYRKYVERTKLGGRIIEAPVIRFERVGRHVDLFEK